MLQTSFCVVQWLQHCLRLQYSLECLALSPSCISTFLLTSSRWWLKHLGLCHKCGRPSLSFGLLISTRPRPSFYKYLGRNQEMRFFFLSAFQIKWKKVKNIQNTCKYISTSESGKLFSKCCAPVCRITSNFFHSLLYTFLSHVILSLSISYSQHWASTDPQLGTKVFGNKQVYITLYAVLLLKTPCIYETGVFYFFSGKTLKAKAE